MELHTARSGKRARGVPEVNTQGSPPRLLGQPLKINSIGSEDLLKHYASFCNRLTAPKLWAQRAAPSSFGGELASPNEGKQHGKCARYVSSEFELDWITPYD